MQNEKITSFTDLNAWKISHQLVLTIYKLTKGFPKEEQFGLISQIRRATVSITSNIAEGFSRNSAKDKSHFYSIALGSLTEVHNQLIIAKDLQYLPEATFNEISVNIIQATKMTSGLVRSALPRFSPNTNTNP